jgi:hypothetical protein
MLKFGLLLFSVASTGVVLRTCEFLEVTSPLFKMACTFTLLLSVFCFLGTYYTAELAQSRSRHK